MNDGKSIFLHAQNRQTEKISCQYYCNTDFCNSNKDLQQRKLRIQDQDSGSIDVEPKEYIGVTFFGRVTFIVVISLVL